MYFHLMDWAVLLCRRMYRSSLLESAAATRAVRIPPDVVVSKEFDVQLSEIQIGDWVDAKGEKQADGTLLAKSGWICVNIGCWEGIITTVGHISSLATTTVRRGCPKAASCEPQIAVSASPLPTARGRASHPTVS